MTPAARIQAAIELLDEVEARAAPADVVLRAYVRNRRYIGSKDRRAIAEAMFATVRARIALDWRLARHGAAPTPRLRVLAREALAGGLEPVAAHCDGGRFAPPPLSPDEHAALAALVAGREADAAAMPLAVRANFPAWLEPELRRRFGDDIEAEMSAFDADAPMDLRVNGVRAERRAVLAALVSLGTDAVPTPLSPHGIRVRGRPQIGRHPAWRDGLIEIQDEGAQVVAMLCEAVGVGCIVDYCAGAGGNTLALAALAPEARLIACDTERSRLARLAPRLARARIEHVETHVIGADEPLPPAVADRLLLDMPCSGTGTWRRNPDDRHRLTPERLAGYCARQDEILAAAAPLVAAGGRLIYATCSLLPCENEDRIEAFLAAHPQFRHLDATDIWRRVLATAPPAGAPYIRLTPRGHATDGFFVAILERTPQT